MDRSVMRRAPAEFRLLQYDVPDFIGDWTQLDYGDPTAERCELLRAEFQLDSIVSGCQSEWLMLLALKRWVRCRWNHGWSRCFAQVKDAVDVLRAAQRGESFNCGFYASVLRECCLALGFPARIVSLALDRCECPRDDTYWSVGHAVPEVWSNDHRKWVVLDPDLNVHYEHNGVPLNALEIHDAWLGGRADTVHVVQAEPPPVLPRGQAIEALPACCGDPSFTEENVARMMTRFSRHQALDYYARLNINGWEWLDPRCLPTFVRHFQPSGTIRPTSAPADLYWTLNLTRATLTPTWSDSGAGLRLAFVHCMPFFSHCELRIDDGPWLRCEASHELALKNGVTALDFCAVNVRDRRGPVSRLTVAYAAPRWPI